MATPKTRMPTFATLTVFKVLVTASRQGEKKKGIQIGREEVKPLLFEDGMILSIYQSVQFSRSVVSDSLQPHEAQHARLPCPSPSLRVDSDSHSRPSSQ